MKGKINGVINSVVTIYRAAPGVQAGRERGKQL